MSRFTKESLNALPVVPDGKGGYRAMTKEEKAAKFQPVKPKPVKKPQGAGYFHGMTLEQICAKYSGGPEGIYIPGNVASSKNGRGLMQVIKEVRPRLVSGILIPSPQTQEYKRISSPYWEKYAPVFKQMCAIKKTPYRINFFFIRPRNNPWDLINMAQVCQDLMVKFSWLENDDKDTIVPCFDEGYGYDKSHPGVIIKIK